MKLCKNCSRPEKGKTVYHADHHAGRCPKVASVWAGYDFEELPELTDEQLASFRPAKPWWMKHKPPWMKDQSDEEKPTGEELFDELLKDNKGPMYRAKWEAVLLQAYERGRNDEKG